ncbi:TniQ family protein [Microvirga massiliensis]|uniref:TniQ family protein n=1 Tax=Microvirga massiliensis TaxID=1033741 RepID=UPI00062BB432|nr:TniQ family protein [Microvirga massiliensis]
MDRTPLPLWFSPLPDEPAHGILLRLAERNGLLASTRVSMLTGLKVAHLRIGKGADRLAAILRCDPAAFMESTPVPAGNGHVMLRGERLSVLRDLTRAARRICPRCISESAHHRFWCDLEFVTTCPTHGTGLVDSCSCGRKLSWSDVRIARCRHCEDGDVTGLPAPPADKDVVETDRWVLGRLGVGTPASVPILDAMTLTGALDTIGRVGALDLGGYRERWAEPSDFDVPVERVRARGFVILRDGDLDALLDRVHAEFSASGSVKPAAIGTAYGWFYHWFNFRKGEAFSRGIAEILLANGMRKFQVQRGTFPGIERADARTTTLRDAARKVRARPDTVRMLLEAESKVLAEGRKGSPVAVDSEDVRRLAAEYGDAVPFARIPELLGVGGTIAKRLLEAGMLPVWIPGGRNGVKHRHVFRRGDLEAWVEALVGDVPSLPWPPCGCLTVAEAPLRKNIPVTALVEAVRDGRIRVIARLSGQPAFGGAVVLASEVEAAMPEDVRRRMAARRSGPRGPYRKKQKEPEAGSSH